MAWFPPFNICDLESWTEMKIKMEKLHITINLMQEKYSKYYIENETGPYLRRIFS